MTNGYTVFFSYRLSNSGNTNNFGYSDSIHCNYIQSLFLETIINKEVNISFNNIKDFKFLSPIGNTGYTANQIYVLIQLIDNSLYSSMDLVKPISSNWREFDVTNQVTGYTTGNTFILTPANITSAVFSVPLYRYNEMKSYNLEYINYPTNLITDDNKLCFGDEEYFLGNVSSDIEAIAYTTDLVIDLPLNQFNSSSNQTWIDISTADKPSVSITEIGLYDSNLNLVAIAKLNDPINKDESIARTIVFGLDF